MIAQYNSGGEPVAFKNILNVVGKAIRMQGFIILWEWKVKGEEFYKNVPAWVAKGELKSKEDVTKGLEAAPDAIVGIFEGKNFGKALVEIWDGK